MTYILLWGSAGYPKKAAKILDTRFEDQTGFSHLPIKRKTLPIKSFPFSYNSYSKTKNKETDILFLTTMENSVVIFMEFDSSPGFLGCKKYFCRFMQKFLHDEKIFLQPMHFCLLCLNLFFSYKLFCQEKEIQLLVLTFAIF